MIAAVVAALLAVPLSLPAYRARLEAIDGLLARGDRARAAAAASALLGATVQASGEELAPAAWALGPIARGDPRRTRLRGVLAALPKGAPSPASKADRSLLETLRRAQEAGGLSAGGEIAELPAPELPFLDQLLEWMGRAAAWAVARLGDLLKWLATLFQRDQAIQPEGGSTRLTALVLAGMAAIVVAVGALALFSTPRPPPFAPAGAGAAPVDEEDPLSRTASGWESRARELAAQGRAREAIRAWYHALLVHCYGAGVLHYRRGRTNWEYAHALSPGLPWRPLFEELTRGFDLEWYGRDRSTPAALEAFSSGAGAILRELRRP